MDLTQEILFENNQEDFSASEAEDNFILTLNRETIQSVIETNGDEVENEEDEELIETEEEVIETNDLLPTVSNYIDINTEIIIQHNFTDLIVNITKVKDKSLKGLLTKFKENLSIVPKISDDDLTITCGNNKLNLSNQVTAGSVYTIYSQHSIKG